MGDWDCYCALCAAPFHCFDLFNEEFGNREDASDPQVIKAEDLEWLENLRVLGFNPNAPGVNKCFITGPATSSDYGSFYCELGEDPNVPPATERGPPARTIITAYSTFNPDEPIAMAFHADCLEVFAQALTYQLHGKCKPKLDLTMVDKDLLYGTMTKLTEECLMALKLDYGELADSVIEQYWGYQPGQEAWVSNPLTSPQITSFLKTIQHQNTISPPNQPESEPTPPHTTNPFSKLAKEITCEILLYLPYPALQALTLSGLLPFHLSSISAFWKRKLAIDMPFLWDILTLSNLGDGFDIYHTMKRHCFATTPETEIGEDQIPRVVGQRDLSLVLGLANRRRVWNTCLQLAVLYEKEMGECGGGGGNGNKNEDVDQEILMGSKSLGVPIVAAPVSKDAKFLSVFLMERWEDLDREWVVKFYFEEGEGGRLCGVERVGGVVFGERRGEGWSVVVGEEVRIVGFVLNVGGAGDLGREARVGVTGVKVLFQDGTEFQIGSDEGDKRLLRAGEGMVVTGLSGELANGVIQRFGLLQCPRGTTLPPTHTAPPTVQRHLWKTSLPQPNIQATTYQTGYWTPARSFDTIPMSFLIFGTTPLELAKITGFSSDAKLRSFGVHFADGSEAVIGPRDGVEGERKVFRIDGAGGEVVTKVEVGMNHLPMAIKITTSHNRIAFFGTNQKNEHVIYEPPPSTHLIAGIYASWGYSADRRKCTTISVLTAAKDGGLGDEGEVPGVMDGTAWSPPGFENARPLAPRSEAIAVANEEDYVEFAGRWW
ncbi:hypothetical protein BKA61DRAFT_729448 [Leptodontidium sp. MPI-SDFR-AT-0119]|nr:hypothetical protein BKA61DRAFT_729448 [Leptodontidium sp. MPI-SDFR-AT-0119]